MIGPLVAAVRDLVVAPQAAEPAPAPGETDRRAYLDPENAPLDVEPTTVEVYGMTSVPIMAQIGTGFAGAAGGVMMVRHTLAVVVTAQHATRDLASAVRDAVTTDLLRRAVTIDWPNVDIGPDQDVSNVAVGIEYTDLETDQLAAYSTLTLTVDAEWRL